MAEVQSELEGRFTLSGADIETKPVNGKTIAEQSPLGSLTSFTLDAASQRICVVDANGGRSTTLYDPRGNVYAELDQLGARTSFSYDTNSNTILKVDARSWPTTYTIDPLNRTTVSAFINGTINTNTWDQAGQQLTMQDVTGITGYVYDLDGRQIAVQNPMTWITVWTMAKTTRRSG